MGQKMLPTIWGTYMKLVTIYQIPVINSCLEKCDAKCAYINVCLKSYVLMLSSALLEMDEEDVDDKDEDIADDDPVLNQIRFLCLLYPHSQKGEGGILFYLCPSINTFIWIFIMPAD
jgi:hypothetical protein